MKFEKISYTMYEKENLDINIGYAQIKLPKRATKYSAGYDIYSICDFELRPNQTILLPTGIKFDCDTDKFLFIAPRSGQGFKYKVQLYNTVGIVDADYYNNNKNEGHIWIKLYNDSPEGHTLTVKQGEAICQGIIMPYFKVEGDEVDGIRSGGFGSTSENVG